MVINEKQVKLRNGKLKRIEDEFGHSYWHDELGYVVGVTTVLQEALPVPIGLKLYWQNTERGYAEQRLEQATQHGSTVHQLIERLNDGEAIETADLSDPVKRDLVSYQEWFREWNPDKVESEQVLFYKDGENDMRFAGTLDLVCDIDGARTLIDFKTASVVGLSAFLQVEAYAKAYEQSYGLKIDKTMVLQLGTSHKKINKRTPILGKPSNGVGWKMHEVDRKQYSFDVFRHVYEIFLLVNDGYPEPPKVVEYPKIFKLYDEK